MPRCAQQHKDSAIETRSHVIVYRDTPYDACRDTFIHATYKDAAERRHHFDGRRRDATRNALRRMSAKYADDAKMPRRARAHITPAPLRLSYLLRRDDIHLRDAMHAHAMQPPLLLYYRHFATFTMPPKYHCRHYHYIYAIMPVYAMPFTICSTLFVIAAIISMPPF